VESGAECACSKAYKTPFQLTYRHITKVSGIIFYISFYESGLEEVKVVDRCEAVQPALPPRGGQERVGGEGLRISQIWGCPLCYESNFQIFLLRSRTLENFPQTEAHKEEASALFSFIHRSSLLLLSQENGLREEVPEACPRCCIYLAPLLIGMLKTPLPINFLNPPDVSTSASAPASHPTPAFGTRICPPPHVQV
jgi:hypothetical protein